MTSSMRMPGDPQRELNYRKRLIEIANMINSASSIQDILVDIKDKVLDLVEARAGDDLRPRHQEPGAVLAVQGRAGGQGDPRPQDVRVDRRLHRASSRRTANIKNAYDAAELARLHPNLKFDSRWDKATGFRTSQVLAMPDPVREVPAGRAAAHQQARRRPVHAQGRGGGRGARQDPRHRLLQPAPRGAHEQAVQVRRARRQGARLREGHRGRGHQRAREPDRRGEGADGGLPASPRKRSAARSASSTTASSGSPRAAPCPTTSRRA